MAQRSSGYSPFSGDAGAAAQAPGAAAAAGNGAPPGGAAAASSAGGTLLAVLEGHTRSVRALALAPDSGDVYTAGNDGAVLAWGAADLRLLGAWRGHAGGVFCLGLHPGGGGALYSGGEDGCVRGWDRAAPGGSTLTTLRAPAAGAVHALALQPATLGAHPLLASAHNDGAVRLWRPTAAEACVALLLGHSGPVFGLALSPDAAVLVSASHDGTARCWRLGGDAVPASATEPPKQLGAAFALRGHANGLTEALAVSPDGAAVFTAANDGDVRKWDARSGATLGVLRGHARSVLCLALSDDGSALYSGSADGTVRAWRAMDGSLVRVLSGHRGAVYALALSPGGGALFSGAYDDTVRGWATADGSCICLLRGHANLVAALRLSPDGATLFSASADNTARVWRVPTLPPLPRLGRAPPGPYDPAAAPTKEEEALAAAMGQLGAFVPPTKAGAAPLQGSHSPADGFTLKPGRDGRARIQMARPADAAQAAPPAAITPPASPQPLPGSRPTLLQPRGSPPAAAAPPASPKPPVSPNKPPISPRPAAAASPSPPPAAVSPPPPAASPPPPVAPAGLPAFAPPPAAARPTGGDALLGGTLRPRAGAAAASPEGRRSPLACRPAEGGATAFGSAGYAGGAAPAAYAPPSADSYVPSAAAAQYSAPAPAMSSSSSSDDFAARVAAARAAGGTFVPIVTVGGDASAEGLTAADSPRVVPPAPVHGDDVAQPGGAGDVAAGEKAVAEGNGCSQGDFVARIARARSSGALSSNSAASLGEGAGN